MVRKKLAKAILALTALQAGLASALGLGGLSLNSSLNQPLRAEIKLLDTGDLDPGQIKVQLAAPEDFQRAGVERDFFLTNLQFSIELDGQGRGVVRIQTREPVVEPYLNFILETRWPNGRLLREYAVLLDPPTFSAAAPARTAPATAAGEPARRAVPPAPAPAPVAAAPSRNRNEMTALPQPGAADQYRVQHGDTLSRIAGRHRPDGANVQQTMLAIQRANPEAFIRNNVNLVKSGYVLRLPCADEVQAIAAGQATEEVAAQNRAWRDGSSAGAVAGGPQLDARPAAASEAGGYREQERLSIASAGDSAKAATGEGTSTRGAGTEALRNELAASQEGLDSAKRENAELQSRLDDMERQIATLQRLLSLKDDQLAALQAHAAADTAEQAPAQQAPAQPTPAQPAPTTPPPAPAAAQPQPTVKPAAKPAVAEPGLVEQITGNPLYLLAGGAALVLALLGVAIARRRRAAAEERDALTTLRFDHDDNLPEDFNTGIDLDNALVSDDAVIPADADRTQVVTPAPQALRSETGDAVAEADIYIAYGRYQQAADLLLTAIAAEPDRSDLRIKLLEVYLEMRNRDAFRQQFAELQARGDEDAIAQIKDVLSTVDGVADWLDDLPGSAPRAGGAAVAAAGFVLGAAAVAAGSAFADDDRDDSAATLEPAADDEDEMLAATALGADAEEDDELALDDLDLDFEHAPDLVDFSVERPVPTDAELAATPPVLDAGPEFDVLEVEQSEEDGGLAETAVDFELDLDDVVEEESAADELADLDFDLDLDDATAAPIAELAPEPFQSEPEPGQPAADVLQTEAEAKPEPTPEPFASEAELLPAAADDAALPGEDEDRLELDLDLADDLDLALDAIDGDDDLEDLAPPAAIAPLTADFDLSLPVGEPAVERPDELSHLDELADELGDLEELDELAALDESADELEPLAAAPTAFTAPGQAANDFGDGDAGDDFDFLADADEVATKLDLARAYIDMGDTDGAKDILDEVMTEGSDTQKQEASVLLSRIA